MFFACFSRVRHLSLCASATRASTDFKSLFIAWLHPSHPIDWIRSKAWVENRFGSREKCTAPRAQNRPARTAEISVSLAADPRADTKRSHNNQPFSAINWYLERNVMWRRLHLATMKARERRRTVGIRMKKYQNEPSASARKTSFPLRTFTGIALVALPNTIVERPEKYRFLRHRLGGEIGTVPERRISWSGGEKRTKPNRNHNYRRYNT